MASPRTADGDLRRFVEARIDRLRGTIDGWKSEHWRFIDGPALPGDHNFAATLRWTLDELIRGVSGLLSFSRTPPIEIWDKADASLARASANLANNRYGAAINDIKDGEHQFAEARQKFSDYVNSLTDGAGRAVFALKRLTTAGEGAAKFLGQKFGGKPGGAAAAAAYGAIEEVASQAGEMWADDHKRALDVPKIVLHASEELFAAAADYWVEGKGKKLILEAIWRRYGRNAKHAVKWTLEARAVKWVIEDALKAAAGLLHGEVPHLPRTWDEMAGWLLDHIEGVLLNEKGGNTK